jgi:cytochrome bd ubiquinol oxidase subunit II
MQAFWFGTICVLWAGFFVLEGFDFGVGMLLPFVARDETDRQVAVRSVGPVWDGNEVWLLVAGGATFAAFPEWYASLFAGFYLAFGLLLVALILRGIGIEYRGKAHTDAGRRWCDVAFVGGSTVAGLLVGVAFANILRGVNMNADHDVTSSFISLLNPYALLGGVVTLTLFALHGALYLALRTVGPVRDRARRLAPALGIVCAVATIGFVLWTDASRGTLLSNAIAVVIVLALGLALMHNAAGRDGQAFLGTAVATLLVPVWAFACLWPDVLPARNNSAYSLTVHNASSSDYTLKVMTVVALIMTPIVLVYQGWSYWVFRARVTGESVGGDGYGRAVVAAARSSARVMLGHEGGDEQPR